MEKTVVLVAGGAGTRIGSVLPKQFIRIQGKPVFIHSIEVFMRAYDEINIILVLPLDYIDHAKQLLTEFGMPLETINLVTGGITRFDSVKNGLSHVPNDHIVFVHDAVRCLVSVELIRRCAESCIEVGASIPVIPLRDSIREVSRDGNSRPIDRSLLRIVQTPQTFLASALKVAYSKPYEDSFTDEATVFEAAGNKLFLIEGEESNIKITYPEDIDFASWKLSESLA